MKKVVIILIGLCFLVTGCSIKKVDELTDAEKFSNEFNVSKSNPFIYKSIDEVLNLLDSGTGIIFLATPDQEGSLKAAEILTSVANSEKIKNIYYYNPKGLKEKSPKKYKKLTKKIGDYLEKDNYNKLDLPNIISVKEGKIIEYSNYFSKKEQLSEEKLSKKKIRQIKDEYKCLINYDKCTSK